MSEEVIIGIDLGTTFSAMASVNPHGKPEIICNREGERTTPSVIFFNEEGNPIVGREAMNRAILAPRRTVRFVKREMGDHSYRLNIDGKDYFPEDLSAIILKKLKKDAEDLLNQEVNKAIISVPAYFKDAQREATKQAGEIAGLDVIRIIDEPNAAALAYGLEKAADDQTILVYDFGGGTFDVTVMNVSNNIFEIAAVDGDSKLGGKDIDGRLVEYFAEEFLREYSIDLRLDPVTHQDLWNKAEIAKKDLSFRENLSVTLASGDKTLRVDIDRKQFNELIEDIIDQTEACMEKAMKDAGLEWSQIDTILLAGGSSRIPAVRKMIERVSGKAAARDMNPDECVAIGAAIQTALLDEAGKPLKTQDGRSADLVLKNVAPHSLGVKALSEDSDQYINSIIIPRLSRIPTKKTKIYTTAEDDAEEVEIEVLQGEEKDPRSPEIDLIGKLKLTDLPSHKAGELIIEVTLSYDLDGVIEVEAKETKSGNVTREVVMKKAGTLSDEIVQEKRESLDDSEL